MQPAITALLRTGLETALFLQFAATEQFLEQMPLSPTFRVIDARDEEMQAVCTFSGQFLRPFLTGFAALPTSFRFSTKHYQEMSRLLDIRFMQTVAWLQDCCVLLMAAILFVFVAVCSKGEP